MKKIYNKPVLEIEGFLTEEIMVPEAEGSSALYDPQSVLSYNPAGGGAGGYGEDPNAAGFIRFSSNDGNVLNSINYNDFNPQN